MLKPVVSAETWIGAGARGHRAASTPAPRSISGRCTGPRAACGGGVMFDPDSTRWCLCLYEAPMPAPRGMSVTLSPFRRPTAETAPVDAKAGCLYPNGARALVEAQARGFDNCLMRDMLGQRRRARQRQRLHGQGRGGATRRPRTAPSSTASPASGSSACCATPASRWSRRRLTLRRLPGRRRDLLLRQLRQGRADHAHRRARPAARPRLRARRAQLYWDYRAWPRAKAAVISG